MEVEKIMIKYYRIAQKNKYYATIDDVSQNN